MAATDPALQGLYTLVTLAATGEERAFGELIRRFERMALGFAESLIGDRQRAEDAVQEAFVEVWRQLAQLREPLAFPSWLRRIVFKHCDRHTRGFQPVEVAVVEEAAGDVADGDQREQLARLLATLPEEERQPALLHYVCGQSLPTIAAFLDCPVSTLKNRLFSARNRMREAISLMDTSESDRKREDLLYQKIMRIIKPEDCERDQAGRDTWDMFCAALLGDVQTLRRKLSDDANRARQYWYTPPIHFAVREGHLEATRLLYEANPMVNLPELLQVAEDREHREVADYLRQCIGGVGDDADFVALGKAVRSSDIAEIQRIAKIRPELLSRRERLPDHRLHVAGTLLHVAAGRGNEEVVRCLLDLGAPIDEKDSSGFRPIHLAFWNSAYWGRSDHHAVARLLLDRGARDSITLAAARGDEAKVREYISRDPSLANDGDTLEKRPLSAAAERSHRAIVELLLKHGADPNLRESQTCPKGSALMMVTMCDDIELARILLERGADPNAMVDSSGWPAGNAKSDGMRALMAKYGGREKDLWWLCQLGELEAVKAMLAEQEDPDWGGLKTPYTAIVSGCERKREAGQSTEPHWALLRLMLARGIRVPDVVTECRTYLFHVPAMTRVLLENGMNPNLPNWQRRTPLHDIAEVTRHIDDANRKELVDLLLSFGADINARDEEYRSTPLGFAVRAGQKWMVEYLLERGAKTNLEDDEPWATPLAWARKRGHAEIEQLLLSRGAK